MNVVNCGFLFNEPISLNVIVTIIHYYANCYKTSIIRIHNAQGCRQSNELNALCEPFRQTHFYLTCNAYVDKEIVRNTPKYAWTVRKWYTTNYEKSSVSLKTKYHSITFNQLD